MKKIGITGCIGSGKSTVSRIFAHLGVPVYDADRGAKALMSGSAPLIEGIKGLFGIEAYDEDGILNRSHLSASAFHDRSLLDRLNALVHPAVFADFDQWCEKHSGHPYVVKEAALMFETDSYRQVNEVIVVTAPEELRIARTMERDQLTREQVLARMKNQMSEDDKLARANHRIVNDDEQSLIMQVLRLHGRFTGKDAR